VIFDVIDRVPEIRDEELDPNNLEISYSLVNQIKFENVSFKYPTAPKE
jgi:hypothetical protein